jgi:hypothetical protein
MKLLTLCIALGFMALAGRAAAQANRTASPATKALPQTQTPLQKELTKFDQDKNGKLDADEQAAYLAAQEEAERRHKEVGQEWRWTA